MKQLIVTVHGIRTFGAWQDRLEHLLSKPQLGVSRTIIAYRYGYFSVIAFLIPPLRWLVVRRFRAFLLAKVRQESWDRIDLVGHSFGTHIIGWGIYGIPEPQRPLIHTVILASSVLKNNFPWQAILGRGVQRLVNDCGTKDRVLILSQFLVLFTGMAGRLGFNGGTGRNFRNRFFSYGHSGYFLKDGAPFDTFLETYWVPLLTTENDAEMVDVRSSSALSGIKATFLNNAEPIKLMVYLAPLIAFIIWITSLYLEADLQRRRAEKTIAASTDTANKLVLDIAQRFSTTIGVPKRMIVELLDQSKKLVDDLAATGTPSDSLRQSRGLVLATLSLAMREEGQLEAAARTADEAVSIFRDLLKVQGNSSRRNGLSVSLLRRGDAYLDQNKSDLALADYRESLSLSKADPTKDDLANSAIGHERIGTIYFKQQNFSDALAEYVESERIRRLLVPSWQNTRDLSISSGKIANALERLGRNSEAIAKYRETIRLTEELMIEAPLRTDIKRDLSVAYQELGSFLKREGQFTEALVYFDKDAGIARELARSDEDRPDWQRDLFSSLGQLGDALTATHRLDDAIKAYEEALTLGERLALKFPDDDILQHDLAVDHHRMGDNYKSKGLYAEAIQSYRRSLDIRVRLSSRSSTPSNWDSELANNYQRLSDSYIVNQQAEQAVEVAEERVKQARGWEENEQTRVLLARALGNLAWYELFARLHQKSLAHSDEGIRLAPGLIAPRLNRAHALMFSGLAGEARRAYLGAELTIAAQTGWHDLILKDFSAFKNAGLVDPLMTEIEAKLKEIR